MQIPALDNLQPVLWETHVMRLYVKASQTKKNTKKAMSINPSLFLFKVVLLMLF
jgi:hypothetical protein